MLPRRQKSYRMSKSTNSECGGHIRKLSYLKMTISGVATTMNNDDHNDLEDYGTPGIDPMDFLD